MALSPAEAADEPRKKLIKRFKLIIVCRSWVGVKVHEPVVGLMSMIGAPKHFIAQGVEKL